MFIDLVLENNPSVYMYAVKQTVFAAVCVDKCYICVEFLCFHRKLFSRMKSNEIAVELVHSSRVKNYNPNVWSIIENSE